MKAKLKRLAVLTMRMVDNGNTQDPSYVYCSAYIVDEEIVTLIGSVIVLLYPVGFQSSEREPGANPVKENACCSRQSVSRDSHMICRDTISTFHHDDLRITHEAAFSIAEVPEGTAPMRTEAIKMQARSPRSVQVMWLRCLLMRRG